ncbi:MAG: efflux RND transporter periplasmic adaptor subunit [Ginsengibacter sp.]
MIKSFLIPVTVLMLFSCRHNDKETAEKGTDSQTESRTPVTVTSIGYAPLQEFIELNATAVYLQKNVVKSNLTGYIKTANIKYASSVKAGQVLFTLKTKESDAIGNTINNLDPGFKFSGINSIRAGAGGYISELDHQAGDYVQDGEQLAVISNVNSFVFMMEVPYEYRQYVINNKQVELILPDGERIPGIIQTSLPFMDSVSQTQAVAIKVNSPQQIPQNLVAKVRIVKISKPAASSLPMAAVLSDEAHSEFWVMKLLNDSTAVKVPVKKGIETDDRIEIISPAFDPKERIIITGNYGLSDTASVKIEVPGIEK